jgi:hypothetical protein
MSARASDLGSFLELRNMEMGLGTWNMRSLYRAGSPKNYLDGRNILWECTRSDERQGTSNQQANSHFAVGN